jgi:Na+:H+ antiporter, NhaA family
LANSGVSEPYQDFWNAEVQGHSLTHWINDGLMAIFFLLIGLELERELYVGELSSVKNSLLPIVAALGGMIVPAGVHLAFNFGSAYQDGAGIPMATDIAFALGVLSLLGSRVPITLRVFLTALAVIDDLGAIIVIAVFYTGDIEWSSLLISLGIFVFLLVLNRLKVHNLIPYLICGVGMWYFMLHSGVHATITGVLLAFAVPFGDGSEKSPSYILQHRLHVPVAFVILPLFALANTNVTLGAHWYHALITTNGLGIMLGLALGKPIGIVLFSFLAIKTKITTLADNVNYKHLLGAGMLGGIGFTMSIFITLLAFGEIHLVDQSKIAVMLASVVAGVLGYLLLRLGSKSQSASND